ncbi:hypothetical protein BRW84_07225 [Oxalobacter formigenes OXCC13]|mgnify:CR=1 FL=1|uniref:Uncharacterized protein n=2 Tax=Oxalobacter formigenes TaxID=847 RepID=C3X8W4_OXAFO|nr:hypothetical protein BRW84_07225 [Oxalobacter formigenes OXCC13]EEO29640.1 hypothetical protein OFBG_00668 [Oxalobacter formigenes OXCC13]
MENNMWGAIIALVASAALEQINSNVVQNRQSREVGNAMRRQREYQRQAEKIAMDNADDFQQDTRADRQNEIKQQLTEQYYKPVEATQTANASNATVQGNVSSDYQQAKAASDTNQLKAAKDFAGLYGQQESAYRLRQNEGLKMADNANQIARINNFSRGMDNVDQYAIRQAARPDGALSFGSQVLGMIGSSMIKGQGKPGNVGFT